MTRQTAIGGLTVLGLVVVGWGVIDAHPLVFAYTEAEYAEARTGRMLMVAGTAALAGAAVLLAGDGAARWRTLAVTRGHACRRHQHRAHTSPGAACGRLLGAGLGVLDLGAGERHGIPSAQSDMGLSALVRSSGPPGSAGRWTGPPVASPPEGFGSSPLRRLRVAVYVQAQPVGPVTRGP